MRTRCSRTRATVQECHFVGLLSLESKLSEVENGRAWDCCMSLSDARNGRSRCSRLVSMQ